MRTELFEGFVSPNLQIANTGHIWLDENGARINFWMSKRRWAQGIWPTLPSGEVYQKVPPLPTL